MPISLGGQDIEVQAPSQRAWGASDQAPELSRRLQLAQARSDMRRIPRAGQEWTKFGAELSKVYRSTGGRNLTRDRI